MINEHHEDALIPVTLEGLVPGAIARHGELDHVGTVIAKCDCWITVLWPDNVSFDLISETIRVAVNRGTTQLLNDRTVGHAKVAKNDIIKRIRDSLALLRHKGVIRKYQVGEPYSNFHDMFIDIKYVKNLSLVYTNLTVCVQL